MTAAEIVREARARAGLTQAELARRMGTTQSAVARLERVGSNPRLSTLEQAVAAVGARLELGIAAAKPSIDETLVAEMLRLTPGERIASFERSYADVRELALAARAHRG